MFEGIIRLLEWLGEKWRDYLSPYCVIREYEGGVLLRVGKYKRILHTGINFKLPIIDEIHTCIKVVDTFRIKSITFTTTDGKAVLVEPILEYEVEDVRKYLLEAHEAAISSHDVAMGVIADFLTDCDWETVKKKTTLTQIKNKVKNSLEPYGINLRKVYFGSMVCTRTFSIFKD